MDQPSNSGSSHPRAAAPLDGVGEAVGERVCRSQAPARGVERWASRRARRRVGYRIGATVGAVFLAVFSWGDDGQVLAKGPANPGHGALECADCHDSAPGTVRQQVQAAVAFGLGLRETAPAIGRLPVTNRICLDCHEREEDHHPTHVFTQPKYADEREEIAAHLCITCHREHSGRHVENTGQFCATCHSGMEVREDRMTPTHAALAAEERWDTCLRCHDFHGNHHHEWPESLEEAFGGREVLRHLDSGTPMYGEKREPARTSRDR